MTVEPHRHHVYSAYDRKYQQTERYKTAHRARMKARYWEIKKLGKKALEGMDVDHKHPLAAGGSNDPSNWRLRSASANRADKTFRSHAGYRPLHLAH
jgi:5-methylcytosine-specific restriction endonuclease McrA